MNAAYGYDPSNNEYTEYFKMSDPSSKIVSINNINYCIGHLPPIKIWYGSNETKTNTPVCKEYAKEFVEAVKNSG